MTTLKQTDGTARASASKQATTTQANTRANHPPPISDAPRPGLTCRRGGAECGRGGRPPATARGDKAAGAWRCLVAPGAARDVSGRERDTQAAGERVGGGEGGAATAGPLDAGEDEVAADQDAWARAVLASRPSPRWLGEASRLMAVHGSP